MFDVAQLRQQQLIGVAQLRQQQLIGVRCPVLAVVWMSHIIDPIFFSQAPCLLFFFNRLAVSGFCRMSHIRETRAAFPYPGP